MTETPRERIRQFLGGRVGDAMRRRLSDDYDLLENGILDSLAVLDVVMFLEQEFGVAVADDELTPENFRTIAGLTALVGGKLGGNGAQPA